LPFLLVGVASVHAQFTLSKAVAEAIARHPKLQTARQKIEAVTVRAVQTRLWENPELGLPAKDMSVNLKRTVAIEKHDRRFSGRNIFR